jgi:signal transduction histidine kinase
MMKPVSIFSYLYGVLAVALLLTVSALFFTIEHIESQSDWEGFARDIHEVMLVAQIECQSTDLTEPCVQNELQQQGFELTRTFYAHDANPVEQWQTERLTLDIFSYRHGYQAQLDEQPGWWVRDSEEHVQELALDNQDAVFDILLTAVLITLTLLAAIALFLSWPLLRLLRWLKQLEQATDALAKEDYSVTLPALNISPFFQLSQRFNRMTGLIRSNLDEKRLLANAMAHEMRTPLSRARLALALLQRQPHDDNGKALLDDMDRYMDELENVTQNSLQLVRLQHSETHPTAIDLDAWLRQKLTIVQGRESTLEWHAELTPITLETDERFLTLIIDNLISNAERYSQRVVQVRLFTQGKAVHIEIQDDGPGIPEGFQEQALQPYSRLDSSRDRRSGGIGLGLALVNTACQRLGIELRMRNTQPGLCVGLEIPIKKNRL